MRTRLFAIAQNRIVGMALATSMATLCFGACGVIDESPLELSDPQFCDDSELSQQDPGVDPYDHSDVEGFFPLDIGDHWTYLGELSLAGEDLPPYVVHTREERTIIGIEDLFGREYVVEQQETIEDVGADVYTSWVRYRQDRAGLYEADVPVTQPPAGMHASVSNGPVSEDAGLRYMTRFRQHVAETSQLQYRDAYLAACDHLLKQVEAVSAVLRVGSPVASSLAGPPGGVLSEEIMRLRYPLHPGREWTIRADPWFAATVEKHEVLDLAPGRMNGYRLFISNETMTPGDGVNVWYGRDGFLGMFIHIATEAIDREGNPVGKLLFEERLFLDSLEISRSRWSSRSAAAR